MCGRTAQLISADALADAAAKATGGKMPTWKGAPPDSHTPTPNASPGSSMTVLVQAHGDERAAFSRMVWGLVRQPLC
eukprot:5355270-Pleurochrysis_carterae.AAC.3